MSILDRYGIREVADVMFYEIDEATGGPGAPVLYLDTLKVSTSEQTAENTSARGGKGNSELIAWDYGKEITLNLEDALFSAKSLAMMYGVDPKEIKETSTVHRTVPASAYNSEGKTIMINGTAVTVTGEKFYKADGTVDATFSKETTAYVTADISVEGSEIIISAEKFPGTYYVTGDTYARSEKTGKDELTWNSSLVA